MNNPGQPVVLIKTANPTSARAGRILAAQMINCGLKPLLYVRPGNADVDSCNALKAIFKMDESVRKAKSEIGRLLHSLRARRIWRVLLQDERIVAVVTVCDGAYDNRALVNEAGRLKIPCFYLSESSGVAGGRLPSSFFRKKKRRLNSLLSIFFPEFYPMEGDGLYCPYVCASNPGELKHLVRIDKIPRIYRLTGNPLHDTMRRDDVPMLTGRERIILFIHQPLSMSETRYWDGLKSAAESVVKYDKFRLVVKLHPKASALQEQYVRHIVSGGQPSGRVEIVRDQSIEDLLSNACLSISAFSTAIHESLLSGVPVLLIKNLFGPNYDSQVDQFGGAVGVSNHVAFCEILEKLLVDPSELSALSAAIHKDMIPNYFLNLDGQSARRVCEFISEIVNT